MSQPIANATELTNLRDALRSEAAKREADGHQCIRVCLGASCIASGAVKVKKALESELADRGMKDKVSIVGTGCLGPCSGGPAVMIDDVFYEKLTPQDAKDIVVEHLGRGHVVERLTHKRPDGRAVADAADMDFFKRQKKILLRHCGPDRPPSGLKITSPATAIKPLPARSIKPIPIMLSKPCIPRVFGAEAERVSRRGASGSSRARPPATANTSSATPMKATPARSWTAAFSKATRIASSKAWPSPAIPSAPSEVTSTSGPNIPWPSSG